MFEALIPVRVGLWEYKLFLESKDYKPKSSVESGNNMEYGVEMELRSMD